MTKSFFRLTVVLAMGALPIQALNAQMYDEFVPPEAQRGYDGMIIMSKQAPRVSAQKGTASASSKPSSTASTANTKPAPAASKWQEMAAKAKAWAVTKWNAFQNKPTSQATGARDVASTGGTPQNTQGAATASGASVLNTAPGIVQSEVEALKAEQPSFVQPQKGTQKNEIANITQEVKKIKLLEVAEQGRLPHASLPVDKVGVAQFPLTKKQKVEDKKTKKVKTIDIKVSEIPLLDVGQEAKIQRNQLKVAPIQFSKHLSGKPKSYKILPVVSQPNLAKTIGSIAKSANPKEIKKSLQTNNRPLTQERVAKVGWKLVADVAVTELAYQPLSENELKMLGALILFARGNVCHLIAGSFHSLQKISQFSSEANYHLGICAHKMGMFTESVDRLTGILKQEDAEYVPSTVEVLISEVPRDYEVQIGRALRSIKNTGLIPADQRATVDYYIGKGASREKNFNLTQQYVERVPASHKYYGKAQFLLAVSQYAQGKKTLALQTQQKLMQHLEQSGSSDKDLKTLVALNLARMQFLVNDHKNAIVNFQKVGKDHPLWIQGLTEQAWSQLLFGDHGGAIGNMYSIHTPFFESVYKPETYVVRSIGYLNICQYPDAFKSLKMLEMKYKDVPRQMDEYIKTHGTPLAHYATIRKYLLNPKQKTVDGLQDQIIREVARQRDFLNHQAALNARQDEQDQIQFLSGLISQDISKVVSRISKAKARQAELKRKIAAIHATNRGFQDLNQLVALEKNEKALIEAYQLEKYLYEVGKATFAELKNVANKKIEKVKSEFRLAAGKASQARLRALRTVVAKVLENNELLKYEVYSGSGRNIRYQAAGGAVGNERKVAVDEKADKQNWNFEGEFWEDEIGNYRSSLKDNCPDARTASAAAVE